MADILEVIIRAKDETSQSFEKIAKLAKDTEGRMRAIGGAGTEAAAGTKALNAVMGDLNGKMSSMAGQLGPLGSALKALGPAGIAAAAAFVAMGGAAALVAADIRRVIDEAGNLTDIAAKVGVTTQALQELAFAGSLVGVSQEGIVSAMSRTQAVLADGSDRTVASLEKLGLSIEQLRLMSPDEQFKAIAAGIREISNPTEQAGVAVGIFGRSFRELMPLIRSDLAAAGAEAERFGAVMSEATRVAGDSLGDDLTRLDAAIKGFKTALSEVVIQSPEVSGALADTVEAMADMVRIAKEGAPFVALFFKPFADMAGMAREASNLARARMTRDGLTMDTGPNPTVAAPAITRPDVSFGEAMGGHAALDLLDQQLKDSAELIKQNQKALADYGREMERFAREAVSGIKAHNDELAKSRAAYDDAQAARAAYIGQFGMSTEQATQEMDRLLFAFQGLADTGEVTEQQLQSFIDKMAALITAGGNSTEALEAYRVALDAVGDESRFVDEQQRKGEIAARKHAEAVRQQQRAYQEFSTFLSSMRGMFEAFGADFMANVVGAFEQGRAAADAWATATTAAGKAAAVMQAATAAYSSGSAVGGAVSGATMGFAIGGPIGAAIGGVAGGILGLFGGKAKVKKELADLRAQLLQSVGGSMEELRKKAAALGVDISKAFTTKNPAELKRIMDQLNKAAEEQKKRWEGVQTALGGLELRTKGFADHMAQVGTVLAKDEDSFQRLGRYAVATFGAYVRETGDVIGALRAMEGSLGNLSDLQAKFGFTGGAAITQLLGMRDVLNANQGVADSLQGLNQLMQGLADQGGITRALFQDFGTDAGAIFQQLIAGGADSNTAMALMQPTLQRLWEAQKKYGAVTDETTAALLKQAEEQGLVGENMRSVNEQILTVLVAIGEALGATIPDALRRMGATAVNEFDRAGDAAERFGNRVPDLPTGGSGDAGYFNGGEPNPGGLPGFAVGGTVTGPTVARVGENGTEHILTPAQLQSYMATAMQAAGGAGGTVVVKVYLDGREISARVEKGLERGEIAPTRGRLKVRA